MSRVGVMRARYESDSIAERTCEPTVPEPVTRTRRGEAAVDIV